ncbi:MAG: isochorismatase family protein [bacterium]|nr:isochorismatase family protein [bacterium]
MAKKAKKVDLTKSALIIVDVQNDFCPGGSLAVPHGDEVVAPLNQMIGLFAKNDCPVFASRDWHPTNTKHFAAFGGKWPSHCVKHTVGADFHKDLELRLNTFVVSKGMSENEDEKSYSAFGGVAIEPVYDLGWAEIIGYFPRNLLKDMNIKNLFVGGLATDYCVKATVLDALKLGFKVYLLEDACRAVNIKPTDGADAIAEMKKIGKENFVLTSAREVLGK